MHVMAETMRRANYDRARYLGDPAFVPLPAKLITPPYAKELAKTIDPTRATPSATLSTEIPSPPKVNNTTHFSVIDHNGMAVANTYTLERRWGSRIVVKNMGFILNNDMRAFNIFPGVTDPPGRSAPTPTSSPPNKRPSAP